MKPKYYIITLFALAISMLFFVKCTKEDLSDCGIVVRFKYDKHIQDIKFSDEVHRIDLYIFDENGNYMEMVSSQPSDVLANGFLPETFEFVLRDIKPGTYTLVAWCNVSNAFFTSSLLVPGASSYNTATLTYNDDDVNRRGPDLSLFYGSQRSVTVESNAGTQVVTIDLMKYSNHVSITASGFPEGFDSNSFNCTIISSDGSYLFNGNFSSNNPSITYRPTKDPKQNGTVIEFDFYILRETNDNLTNSKLRITYTRPDGSELVLREESLVNVLKSLARTASNPLNTGDLDIDHEFFISIDIIFNETSNTVSVTIKDWDPVQQVPRPLY